jgi:hypothetical protein
MRKFVTYAVLALFLPFVLMLAPIAGALATLWKVVESWVEMVRNVARS